MVRRCVRDNLRHVGDDADATSVSSQFRIIISITLSLAGVIVIILASVVVSRRCNSPPQCNKSTSRDGEAGDNDSRIFPRSAEPLHLYADADEVVLPGERCEAVYSYPDFSVVGLGIGSVSDQEEEDDGAELLMSPHDYEKMENVM